MEFKIYLSYNAHCPNHSQNDKQYEGVAGGGVTSKARQTGPILQKPGRDRKSGYYTHLHTQIQLYNMNWEEVSVMHVETVYTVYCTDVCSQVQVHQM